MILKQLICGFFQKCMVLCFSCSVNRCGENRLHQQTNFSLLFSHQIPRVPLFLLLYAINLVWLRVRGEMDWHLTSETFWLPIFRLMPREPTPAKPHDRQPIKEYNDLPTLLCFPACPPSPPPQSQQFSLSPSLCTLINFQTNLFIVHCCLSAEVAGTIDPFSPHTTAFTLTLKMARNYSLVVFFHFTFAQRRGAQSQPPQSLYFLTHFSLSHFALQAILTFLKVACGAEEGASMTSKWVGRLVCWFLKDPLNI